MINQRCGFFQDLKLLMDPSRNMSRYRNLFNGERAYPPLVSHEIIKPCVNSSIFILKITRIPPFPQLPITPFVFLILKSPDSVSVGNMLSSPKDLFFNQTKHRYSLTTIYHLV